MRCCGDLQDEAGTAGAAEPEEQFASFDLGTDSVGGKAVWGEFKDSEIYLESTDLGP
jgi:hypothetical protein